MIKFAGSGAGKACKIAAFVLLFCAARQGYSADFDRHPDAIINSASLSELPKDVIAIPILKDLLTEDFVFYYRDSGAHWLSFRGALARIAFEQEMDWPTRLMSWIMNGPAEIAFWKADDGKLSHFMLVIDQTGVKDLVARIAQSAVKDSQLRTDASTGRDVWALKLSTGKTVYLAHSEGRLFVYSDLAMKLPVQEVGRGILERAKAFFGGNSDVSVFGPKLGSAKHLISVSAQYLSFGYQAFFGSIRAFRFAFSDRTWSTRILTDASNSETGERAWTLMPKGAAFCLSLPIDKKAVDAVIHTSSGAGSGASSWLKQAGSDAIACWYPDSRFYTPVIALGGDYKDLLRNSKETQELKALFARMIGVRGAFWKRPKAEGESESEGAPAEPELVFLPVLPVVSETLQPGQVGFTREIGGRYGLYPSKQSKNAQKLGSARFFRAKVAATAQAIVFSPDDRLVDKALTTLSGKFPSMSSALPPATKSPALVLAPEAFSKLAKASILESLPESQESVFRTAVSRHLFPNLERFGKRPLQAASVIGAERWKEVEWVSHAAR